MDRCRPGPALVSRTSNSGEQCFTMLGRPCVAVFGCKYFVAATVDRHNISKNFARYTKIWPEKPLSNYSRIHDEWIGAVRDQH